MRPFVLENIILSHTNNCSTAIPTKQGCLPHPPFKQIAPLAKSLPGDISGLAPAEEWGEETQTCQPSIRFQMHFLGTPNWSIEPPFFLSNNNQTRHQTRRFWYVIFQYQTVQSINLSHSCGCTPFSAWFDSHAPDTGCGLEMRGDDAAMESMEIIMDCAACIAGRLPWSLCFFLLLFFRGSASNLRPKSPKSPK